MRPIPQSLEGDSAKRNTTPVPALLLTYIAVFGLGSIMGMMLVGMVVSLPVLWSLNLGRPVFLAVQGLASLGSVAVGLTMMLHIVFDGQLF